jgi:hypothetical protein
MRRFELQLVFLLLLLSLATGMPSAGYWFQSGARASGTSSNNNGASVEIETVLPQQLGFGTMGFWVGENLPNGAFLQVGYVIENQTGNYPINCTVGGCSGSAFVSAGDAEWFYEYFLPGDLKDAFLGSIGPDGSAGVNGDVNTYSFYSLGNTWYFQFNNQTIGSANLGVSNSGPYVPLALAEVANSTNTDLYMKKVAFANLSAYKYDTYLPVSEAYGTIGYGVGSMTNLRNPYGVQEIGNRINFFQVGSGVTQSTNNTKLWTLGYTLKVISDYGNISSGNSYTAYSSVTISAPKSVYFGNYSRAVFQGWSGVGLGSYTGTRNIVTVSINANINEAAIWQVQNFVNVTSKFGNATGTGWYNNNSNAYYAVDRNVEVLNGKQMIFSGWSNGNKDLNGSVAISAPVNITARWKYRTSLLGKDAYGETLSISSFTIDGQQTNSTPLLAADSPHALQGAYYKGVTLPLEENLTEYSPSTISLQLPIYNISISTVDFFGLPINVSAAITFKNGTRAMLFSGSRGMISIRDAPYGYASVQFTNLGVKTNVTADGGGETTERFISSINIGTVVLTVLLAIYLMIWRKRSMNARA